MNFDKQSVVAAIKAKIMVLAKELDSDASELQTEDIIPATGLIDSAGLLDLIAWFEATYGFQIATQDFTIDNLGSMDAMAEFLRKSKGLS